MPDDQLICESRAPGSRNDGALWAALTPDQKAPGRTVHEVCGLPKNIPMLENLTGYYKAADGQTKKKILGCIFSEKLVFEKGKDATTPF